VRTKELGSHVEGKAAESGSASAHISKAEAQAPLGSYSSPLSVSQPGELPIRQIHSARLHRRSHFQSSYAGNHLLQLQRRYGNRYVQRVLSSRRQGEAEELTSGLEETTNQPPSHKLSPDRGLRARRASSFKADFRGGVEGTDDPGSSSGEHFPVYGRKHTAPQGPSALPAPNQTVEVQGKYSTGDAPNIQRAWYNFSIPFTDYEFDPSIEGIKTAANVAKDTVVDSAKWVKDKAVAGFQWVFDKIKDLVSAGIEWLNDKFSAIKEFAVSSFDSVRTGLSNLLAHITSPMSLVTTAFNTMNADLLATAWNALSSGASLVWNGIKSVIDGIFKVGTGLWESASGFVTSLFDNVNSILDSWPFRQLPEFLQSEAKALFSKIRSLWEEIRGFISDTLKRLRAFADGIIKSVESFVQRVVSYAIQKVIETVGAIKKAWEFVKKIADDPEGFVRPIIDQLVGKLNTEAPPKAIELGQEKLRENFKGGQSSAAGRGIIQRQTSTASPTRSTVTSEEADQGIIEAIKKAWASLDLGKMLWESFVNMFWPPATIRAIGHEFSELWSKDWANAVANFFTPRSILDDPAGFFHDVWSNVLVLLDFPLALWRRLNNVLMLLLGYLTIVLVIVGAVGGGIAGAAAGGVGAIPGALAGAWAGLELAGAIGLGLLASYFAAESISIIKLIVELRTARQTKEEKNLDYEQIAASLIGMAVAAVLVAILWLLSEFVAAIVRTVKAGRAGGALVKPPAEEIKPVTEGKPAAEPKLPAKEVKSPAEEVKPPAEESKPPAKVEPEPTGQKPVEPRASVDKLVICRVCDTVPGVPADLMAKRAKLSPDARARLDRTAASIFSDPPNPTSAQFQALRKFMEAMEKKGSGDLETGLQKLIAEDAKKKAPPPPPPPKPPFGSEVHQLPGLRADLEALITEIDNFAKANPDKATITKAAETLRSVGDGSLKNMETGQLEASQHMVEQVKGNIEGAKGELKSAETAPSGTKFGEMLDGREIDQIRHDGTLYQVKRWDIFTKADKQFAKVEAQLKGTLEAAVNNPVNGKPRSVVMEFQKGVKKEVADALKAIDVNGHKATIIGPEVP
jgi:Family of unknown function (DUF6861)